MRKIIGNCSIYAFLMISVMGFYLNAYADDIICKDNTVIHVDSATESGNYICNSKKQTCVKKDQIASIKKAPKPQQNNKTIAKSPVNKSYDPCEHIFDDGYSFKGLSNAQLCVIKTKVDLIRQQRESEKRSREFQERLDKEYK
ncbi:MAG: hypothetical protein L7F77_04830 [Candidatus Magnetominusculus sp. LBB02]|nr:hypothetical protein [Candidatus Magnetominusculus sp. LBB02]